jgi:type III pantothenate kinase
VETSQTRTYDEYGILVRQLFAVAGIDPAAVTAVAISSVVPPLAFTLEQMSLRYFKVKPLFVGPGVKTGMSILYENPREVGADRVVNAVAAFERWRSGLIVVDFGTATTFDAVSPKGEYLGGAICPGIAISMDALFRHASKLPRVEFQKPPHVVGKNTVASIQSGLVYGYVGLVDGICARMSDELGFAPKVVATGGSRRSSPACRRPSPRWTSTSRSTASASCTSGTGERPDLPGAVRGRPGGRRGPREGSPRSPPATSIRPTSRSGARTGAILGRRGRCPGTA